MIYALIIAAGLIIVALLFVQLNREARVQNTQVKKFFNKLALYVYYVPENAEDGERVCTVCPIVSTSITCGRQSAGAEHQLDLPVPTSDDDLAGTAAEFFIEPDGGNLQLYVRLLEQKELWICNADRSKTVFLVKDKTPYLPHADGKKAADILDTSKNGKPQYTIPWPPSEVWLGRTKPDISTGKLPLRLGYKVLMGNTLIEVDYDRRKK